MATMSGRDLRIDCFRGVALLIIFIDHLEWGVGVRLLRRYTLQAMGFSDAAEVFVFVSGYVFGLVYEKVRAKEGCLACQLKALRRCGEIYIAYVLTTWCVLFVVIGLLAGRGYLHGRLGSEIVLEYSTSMWALTAALLFQPDILDILPTYMLFLLVMPTLLAVLRWKSWVAVLVSGLLYSAAQLFPWFNLQAYPGGTVWFFNPFAWQFLFFIGVVLGVHIEHAGMRLPRNWQWGAISTAVLAVSFFIMLFWDTLTQHAVLADSHWSQYFSGRIPLTGKTPLQPIRIIHFLILAYFITWLLPRGARVWQSLPARPLILAGQHPLEVFCFGTILTYLCVPLPAFPHILPRLSPNFGRPPAGSPAVAGRAQAEPLGDLALEGR